MYSSKVQNKKSLEAPELVNLKHKDGYRSVQSKLHCDSLLLMTQAQTDQTEEVAIEEECKSVEHHRMESDSFGAPIIHKPLTEESKSLFSEEKIEDVTFETNI